MNTVLDSAWKSFVAFFLVSIAALVVFEVFDVLVFSKRRKVRTVSGGPLPRDTFIMTKPTTTNCSCAEHQSKWKDGKSK